MQADLAATALTLHANAQQVAPDVLTKCVRAAVLAAVAFAGARQTQCDKQEGHQSLCRCCCSGFAGSTENMYSISRTFSCNSGPSLYATPIKKP